jgi:protein subunit release factor B
MPLSKREAAQQALALEDRALLAECEQELFTAGGPGGQHRNKTASGVRLTHPATELSVTATERRSQSLNRRVALKRLRRGLRILAKPIKVRRQTMPTEASRRRRRESKARLSAKKALRRPANWTD